MTIAKNAGIDGATVVAKVEGLEAEFGYDAMNNEYVNMIEKGIIDPTKVQYTKLIKSHIQYTNLHFQHNLSGCQNSFDRRQRCSLIIDHSRSRSV